MSVPAKKVPLFDVIGATEDDVRAIFEPGGMGERFFHESEFGQFTGLDLEMALETLVPACQQGSLVTLIGTYKGEPAGFIMFTVTRHYTTDPLAQLFLLYVDKGRRLSPLGRGLMLGAERVAQAMGACVFYAGATANIGGGADERLMNLLDKFGYTRLAGVSRKILKETDA